MVCRRVPKSPQKDRPNSRDVGVRAQERRLSRRFMLDNELTPKESLYVIEYLVDLNQTQAAIRAGYSPEAAANIASVKMAKPHICEAIAKAMRARAARTQITADRVLQELGRIGFADPDRYYDGDGDLVSMSELTADERAAIRETKIRTHYKRDKETGDVEVQGYTKEIKLHPKEPALKLLAKHLGVLHDKITVDYNETHEHQVTFDYSSLSEEEMAVLLKLIGARYATVEDMLCPSNMRQ